MLLVLIYYCVNPNIQLVVTKCRTEEIGKMNPRGLEQHPPIKINSDDDLTAYRFPGLGSKNHPYLIRNLNITTNERTGIYISKTTKHIIIQNCYIDALNYGIEIIHIADETLLISQNILTNNRYYGAFLWGTSSANISFNNNIQNGDGVSIFYSDNILITNNSCIENTNYGIYLSRSKSCNITYNVLKENEYYGVVLGRYTEFCAVHHNYFIDNNLGGTSQAYDHGYNNIFYDIETEEGNWWNDWYEGYYDIDGNTLSVDYYPLEESTTKEETQKSTYYLLSIAVLFPVLVVLCVFKKLNKKK